MDPVNVRDVSERDKYPHTYKEFVDASLYFSVRELKYASTLYHQPTDCDLVNKWCNKPLKDLSRNLGCIKSVAIEEVAQD